MALFLIPLVRLFPLQELLCLLIFEHLIFRNFHYKNQILGSHEKKLLEKQMGFHTFVSMSKAFVQMIESILLSTKERPLVATYKTSSERIDALNKEGKIELSELSWEDTICYDFIITGVVSLWEDPSNLRTGLHMMRRATWFLDKIANRLAPKGQLLVELDSLIVPPL